MAASIIFFLNHHLNSPAEICHLFTIYLIILLNIIVIKIYLKKTMELELEINIDEICRTCLERNKIDELKSIFTKDIVNGNIVLFSNIFQEATNSKVYINLINRFY